MIDIKFSVKITGIKKPFIFKNGKEEDMLVWNEGKEDKAEIVKVSSFNGEYVVALNPSLRQLDNNYKPVIYDNVAKLTPTLKKIFKDKILNLENE